MPKHSILGGKVHVYKRDNSKYWQCSTYMRGKNRRATTKEDSLSKAKEVAEDWYFQLRTKAAKGELKSETTFKQASEQFVREYETITEGERNPEYAKDHERRLRNHLLPYFGDLGVSEIKAGTVQEYRIHRRETNANGKPPARSTMHHEIVTLRQVLKTAVRHDWLEQLPDLSMPYGSSGKITHRAWFSPEEYRRLYECTRKRVQKAKGKTWQHAAEQLHDYVLFVANTGLRPDKANRLECRDVTIVEDEATNETILEIEVRGKRGVGYCKSTAGAIRPFERLRKRNTPKPTDLLFPANHKKQFNSVLTDLDLKIDRAAHRLGADSLLSLPVYVVCSPS